MKAVSILNRLKQAKKRIKRLHVIACVVVLILLAGVAALAVAQISGKNSTSEAIEAPDSSKPSPDDTKKVVTPDTPEEPPKETSANSSPTPAPSISGSQGMAKKPPASATQAAPPTPLSAQIFAYGSSTYCGSGARIAEFGSASITFLGTLGGELRWQTEANVGGITSVVTAGSAIIARGQATHDLSMNDLGRVHGVSTGDMLRVHITSPSDVASAWYVVPPSQFSCEGT